MLLGAVLMTVASSAQFVYQKTAEKSVGNKIQTSEALPEFSVNRAVLYEDDFSDCSRWTIGNALEDGFTQFVDLNFECGVGLSCGGFAPIDAIESTTADNGFMMVDSDEYGGEEGGTGVENCYIELDSILDFTDNEFVSIKFETQYRMWDGGADDGNEYCLVEFSLDGGATWPSLENYEDEDGDVTDGLRYELWPDMETQDPVNNPTLKVFNVSVGVGNEPNVKMRFRWKGTWGYAWFIDDLEIFETPENDLTIVDAFAGDIVGDYNYYSIPTSQVKPMEIGAVMFNYGYTDQVDAEMTFDYAGAETGSVDPFMYSLEAGGEDTLLYVTDWTPMAIGDYTITVSVPEDDLTAGDVATADFERTDFIYGHNTPELFARGYDEDYEYAMGNVYFMEEDADLGGLNIYFADGTILNDGEVFEINVYVVGDDIQDLSNVGTAEIGPEDLEIGVYKDYTFSEANGGDGAVQLFAGNSYVVEVRKFFGENRIFVGASNFDDDFSTVNWGPFGVDDAENWYVGYAYQNAVRMNLDGAISVDEKIEAESFTMSQNIPNPASDITRINYTLNVPSEVTLTVTDMTGRIVSTVDQGTQSAGAHNIEIDVRDLSSGVYTYTMTVGAEQVTKQLIVK